MATQVPQALRKGQGGLGTQQERPRGVWGPRGVGSLFYSREEGVLPTHLQLRFSTENSTWHTVGGPRTPGYCYGFFVPPAVTWLWALPWAPNTQAPPSRSLPGVPSLCPGPAQLFPMDVFSKTWQQVSYRLESQSCGECKRYFELSAAEGHESKGCVYWRSSPRYQTTTFALFTLIGNA